MLRLSCVLLLCLALAISSSALPSPDAAFTAEQAVQGEQVAPVDAGHRLRRTLAKKGKKESKGKGKRKSSGRGYGRGHYNPYSSDSDSYDSDSRSYGHDSDSNSYGSHDSESVSYGSGSNSYESESNDYGSHGSDSRSSYSNSDGSDSGSEDTCAPYVSPGGNPVVFGENFECRKYANPSVWQNTLLSENPESPEMYDVSLIGAGAASAAIIQTDYNASGNHNFAMFEATQQTGGRLLSSFGAGSLGRSVRPFTKSLQYPPPEYGGMRVIPAEHTRVYAAVVKFGNWLYKQDEPNNPNPPTCVEDGAQCTFDTCCPNMLSPMRVQNVKYRTFHAGAGEYMESVTIADQDGAVNAGLDYTPFVACNNLNLGVQAYMTEAGRPPSVTMPDAVKEACAHCETNTLFEEMCTLCGLFPDPTYQIISCGGVDFPMNSTWPSVTGAVQEFISSERVLFLFVNGYARFIQGLLFANDDTQQHGVAPHFGKTLYKIELACGSVSERAAAQAAVATQNSDAEEVYCDPEAEGPAVTLYFTDGSIVTTKNAVLTMLPQELPLVEGLEAWAKPVEDVLVTTAQIKFVLSWSNVEEAPAARLNMIPCAPTDGTKPECQRLILDGDDGWLIRQVWLWDEVSIMVYCIAPPGNRINQTGYPTSRVADMSTGPGGMGELVNTLMEQFRVAIDIPDLVMPTWARLKYWPQGSVSPAWTVSDEAGEHFSNSMRRPLGTNVPVFYANSEMSKTANFHGWVEGSFEHAEQSYDDLQYALQGYKFQNQFHLLPLAHYQAIYEESGSMCRMPITEEEHPEYVAWLDEIDAVPCLVPCGQCCCGQHTPPPPRSHSCTFPRSNGGTGGCEAYA